MKRNKTDAEMVESLRSFFLKDRESSAARFHLLLDLFGPGSRRKCPKDGKTVDSLGNKCKGPFFMEGWFADGTWYCPVHGQVGPKVTSSSILKRMKADKAWGIQYGRYDDAT